MLKRDAVPGSPGSSGDADPTLIFLHVPKTGGITMRKVIRQNYPPDERYEVKMRNGDYDASFDEVEGIPAAQKLDLRIVFGHVVFGVHEHLPGPAAYFTMVRRPASLAQSAYHFLRRRQESWLHDQVAAMTDVDEFVRSDVARQGDNIQTRLLAGEFSWTGVCTEETLERAKRNLDEHFAAVGLTERFDESVLLWGRRFGWPRLRYVKGNVTPKRAKAPATPEIVAFIEEHNRFDAELYRSIAERFERDLAASYPTIEQDLARYRRSNARYQRFHRFRPRMIAKRVRALAGRS